MAMVAGSVVDVADCVDAMIDVVAVVFSGCVDATIDVVTVVLSGCVDALSLHEAIISDVANQMAILGTSQ